MEHLLRNAAGSEQSQPKREAMFAVISQTTGEELPQPFGAHILPTHALDGKLTHTPSARSFFLSI